MILVFKPDQSGRSIKLESIPKNWQRHLVGWSAAEFYQMDFGSALIQQMETAEFSIFIWTLKIDQAVRLYPLAVLPTIALQFTLEGNIPCTLKGFGEKTLRSGTFEMFYVPAGKHEAWFEPGFYETLHIELKPSFFEALIAIRPEFGSLVDSKLESSEQGIPMAEARMNYITRGIIQQFRNSDKQGAALNLDMHKYILELLSAYFTAISEAQRVEDDGGSHHRELMNRVKEYILTGPNIHDHTIERLSKQFGISESMLRRSFKDQFHSTVAEFVHGQVMIRSYHLIMSTTKSIEDVAEEVGYAWRPAFEAAFKKFYKRSPSRIRHDHNS